MRYLYLVFIILISLGCDRDADNIENRVFSSNGKNFSYEYRDMSRLNLSYNNKHLNQNSAENAYLLWKFHLSKLDIESALSVVSNPDETRDKLVAHIKNIGTKSAKETYDISEHNPVIYYWVKVNDIQYLALPNSVFTIPVHLRITESNGRFFVTPWTKNDNGTITHLLDMLDKEIMNKLDITF